ncbi:MAG: peptidyl-dipeptidase Dcp [Myxococcota bacterium]|jgi:peptidyl-dipeptidase Dcp
MLTSLLLSSALLAAEPALLREWTGPYGGLPPFDQPAPEDFGPALEAAMAAYQAEIDRIAANPERATFDNTIAALEDAGRALNRVEAVYDVHLSTNGSDALRAVESEMAPKLSALRDSITQNQALFDRIKAVYTSRKLKKRTPAEQRLTARKYTEFTRNGAQLDAAAKERTTAINAELAGLYTQFKQNLLADGETVILLESEDDVAGLPASVRAAAKAAAEDRGLTGWAVVNTRSSVAPFLTYATRRDLRERVWRAFYDRGDMGGDTDNNAIITRILALRAERSALLGFDSFAHWRLVDSMAGTPEAATALMRSVWKPAVARVREEVAEQQALADAEGADITIAPWDYRLYSEKVRSAKYAFDQDQVKAYLELEQLREGMFWVAGELYGLNFTPIDGVPVVSPDVRVWEVTGAGGAHVGLWYFDPFARPGKRSGAWMNAYRPQERFRGAVSPLVSNNCNFVAGAPGEPVLISWDDAETLFHEFGHAVHGLLSNVDYPSQAGTNVKRDYVEFPSQLHEHWLSTPEVLTRFAKHHETGEPLPMELVDALHEAANFGQGFATLEYLASAIVDMELHLADAESIDPDAFERETLAELGMPDELVMRHRTPQFGHIFSGEGYAAGYYSYLWADTLTSDAAAVFHEAGSMYDPDVARSLVEHVLSVGDTIDPAEGFRAFRGRDVDVEAWMRDRGFAE